MSVDLILVLRWVLSICAAYALLYACMALARPARFLRKWDITRRRPDYRTYARRWLSSSVNVLQGVSLFVGTVTLGWTLIDTLTWMLPDDWKLPQQRVAETEEAPSLRLTIDLVGGILMAAGFLSHSSRLAKRAASLPGHWWAKKDAGVLVTKFFTSLAREDRDRVADQVRTYLETARARERAFDYRTPWLFSQPIDQPQKIVAHFTRQMCEAAQPERIGDVMYAAEEFRVRISDNDWSELEHVSKQELQRVRACDEDDKYIEPLFNKWGLDKRAKDHEAKRYAAEVEVDFWAKIVGEMEERRT